MSDKQAAKERALMLKQLRADHIETVERSQTQLKEQQQIRKQIKKAMKEGPATVPEVAAAANIPTNLVLWYMVTMKKYDLVNEVAQDGEHYQYGLSKE